MTGLIASMSLVISNLSSITRSYAEFTASQIAIEGIEVVRNIRDSNWLVDGRAWDAGLNGDGTAIAVFNHAQNTWLLDFGPNSMTDESTLIHREGNFLLQNVVPPAGVTLPYRRLITIDSQGTDYKKMITSEVQWDIKGEIRSIMAQEELYDWR